MNILALDLSLCSTGICLPDGETFVIDPGKRRGAERLQYIRDVVLNYCRASLSIVAIEGYAFGKTNQAHHIGELGGVVRLALYEAGKEYVEIPPASRCKYATGKGNASKDDVLQQAVLRSGHAFKDNNAADAFWLWQAALAHYDPTSPRLVKVPLAHLAALDKVDWPQIGGMAA